MLQLNQKMHGDQRGIFGGKQWPWQLRERLSGPCIILCTTSMEKCIFSREKKEDLGHIFLVICDLCIGSMQTARVSQSKINKLELGIGEAVCLRQWRTDTSDTVARGQHTKSVNGQLRWSKDLMIHCSDPNPCTRLPCDPGARSSFSVTWRPCLFWTFSSMIKSRPVGLTLASSFLLLMVLNRNSANFPHRVVSLSCLGACFSQ